MVNGAFRLFFNFRSQHKIGEGLGEFGKIRVS
jgi:hypothetical protein